MKKQTCGHAWPVILITLSMLALAAASPSKAMAGPNDRIVVSFGDSYSSGEGCPPFYGQESADKYSEEDWLAHRSQNSWEGQLVLMNGTRLKDVKASQLKDEESINGDNRWYFYASSGAVSTNVYSQETNPETGKPHYQTKEVEQGIVESGTPYHIAPFDWDEYTQKVPHDLEIQVDAALKDLDRDGLNGGAVDYVTMSIGGNDVGFASIVTEMALRRGVIDRDYLFNAMNTVWDTYDPDRAAPYQQTRKNLIPSTVEARGDNRPKKDEIKACYKRIAKEFPNAQILIVGYPTLFNDDAFEKVLERSGKEGWWDSFLTWVGLYDDNAHNLIGFASWEGWFVNQNVKQFNSALSTLVSETNIELMEESGSTDAPRIHFISVEGAFDGHEAYTKIPYIQKVIPTQSEDLVLIPPISSYSMHPNHLKETKKGEVADGISAYREAVQKKLTELEEAKPLVAYLDGEPESDSNAIQRKLVSSFHISYDSKKWPDQSYEEWVNATYDDAGRITHKEIIGTWPRGYEGEIGYSLSYEYDSEGRLSTISGTEGESFQAIYPDYTPGKLKWDVVYEEDGFTSRASGLEFDDPRHVIDVCDGGGNLVSRDFLIRTGQITEDGSLALSYDANARLVHQSVKSSSNGGPYVRNFEISATYDSASRLSSIEILDSDGKLFSKREYEYDSDGRMSKRNFFYDGSNSNLTVNQSYLYDEKGHLTSGDQKSNEAYWSNATATFTTDSDGSIISARIEAENFIRTYEVEYITVETPGGQEPFNAVDLTDPFSPELYNELWVSHANLDPTPFDESEFLRANRRWLELHDPAEVVQEEASGEIHEGATDAVEGSDAADAGTTGESVSEANFDNKNYWVVFTEGYRDGRVEASSFNVSSGSPTLVWDEGVAISGATLDGTVSQFRLREDGVWEKIGEYGVPTDWALEILASNVPIVDSSGNRIEVPEEY